MNRLYSFLVIWLKTFVLVDRRFICEECVVSLMKHVSRCVIWDDWLTELTFRSFQLFSFSLLISHHVVHLKSNSSEFHYVLRIKQISSFRINPSWEEFISDVFKYKPNLVLRIFDWIRLFEISNIWKPIFSCLESNSKQRRVILSLGYFCWFINQDLIILLWNKAYKL